eukprot:TRINITY_DN104492_c0_g1_i1.p1 TRINITY_DN104492_c0_g1~~TRINITY_DN104492_c0_g1_i1.p1  ORF type:complete len:158 (-),score=28.06 TRINITY_DN104492_c0_g1_i1:15-488(-)
MPGGVASLFILNRNGSLIYDQDLVPGAVPLSANDKIRLSSVFHGISACAEKLSPIRRDASAGSFDFLRSSGIQVLDADTFRLQCFHTATGMKIFALLLPPVRDCEDLLRATYGLYSDHVLKNPFYELDMPVRCEPFDREVRRLFGVSPDRSYVTNYI